jgi:DNA-binding response OmpR family regulator
MDKQRLLLIDDDPIIRAIYRDRFQAAGFDIRTAEDGDEGLKALADYRPDVVVLDLNMPRVDGLQWLRAVRDTAQRNVPVVVLTSADQDQVHAAEDDAVYVMRKDTAEPWLVVETVITAADTR